MEGQYPTKNLEAPSYIVSLRAEVQNVYKAASILFIIHDARDGNYYGWTLPLVL